ncbi:MAG: CHRD domain-containing protein [Gammaproteobacteria bacterium]
MRTKVELRLVAAAALALLAAPLSGVTDDATEATFKVVLTGPQVSGDPDGQGEGTVTLNPETGEATIQLTYSNIAEPTQVHIRRGATGIEGNIVGTFHMKREGRGRLSATGSVRYDHVQPLIESPENYYLVVQNNEHVVGALRGPLRK